MHDPQDDREHSAGLLGWAKLAAGAVLLVCAVLLLMQGHTPPGPAGEVFRNNLRHDIDATPLFYTDVESLLPNE